MNKKQYIITTALALLIIFSNIYFGKTKSDMDSSLNDIIKTANAESEYLRPLAQKPDGTYCCLNTQYTSCSASALCN